MAQIFCSKRLLQAKIKNCKITMHLVPRAYVLQKSGLHLNLLDPDPGSWTDEDLAIGLSRTFRWGGHSTWPLPLSVAQHSLFVLVIFSETAERKLTAQECLRELLHDADEALIGGFDPISPLKPFLGDAFKKMTNRLMQVVFERYKIDHWSSSEYKSHKRADVLAAASEAVHVARWTEDEVHDILNIGLKPIKEDPLAEAFDCKPWEPWPPTVAAERFFYALKKLQVVVQGCSQK